MQITAMNQNFGKKIKTPTCPTKNYSQILPKANELINTNMPRVTPQKKSIVTFFNKIIKSLSNKTN